MIETKPKVIIICGPTASGKSSFAIKKAQEINGEIISADSRQVYKGLEFFSGAILSKDRQGITHHLISILKPTENFTVFDFQQKAEKIIQEILERGKVPIIVGGSSFYIESLIYKNLVPEVKPNKKFRKLVTEKNTTELFKILQKKDPVRAENIDAKNRRRLIRALEIVMELGKVPKLKKKINNGYNFEVYYINPEKNILDQKIKNNFLIRVDKLLGEAEKLKRDISKKRFRQLGLAFKFVHDLWNKKISREEFIALGIKEEQKYAKRQNTYLRKFLKNLPEVVKRFDF